MPQASGHAYAGTTKLRFAIPLAPDGTPLPREATFAPQWEDEAERNAWDRSAHESEVAARRRAREARRAGSPEASAAIQARRIARNARDRARAAAAKERLAAAEAERAKREEVAAVRRAAEDAKRREAEKRARKGPSSEKVAAIVRAAHGPFGDRGEIRRARIAANMLLHPDNCQTALNIDPRSASKTDPLVGVLSR